MALFVSRQGKQYGPYDLDEVQAMLRAGTFAATDYVWQEGTPDWQPLGEFLAAQETPAAASSTPPPLPPPIPDGPPPIPVRLAGKVVPGSEGMTGSELKRETSAGGRFAIYRLLFVSWIFSFKGPSEIYFQQASDDCFDPAFNKSAVTRRAGWGGIPWGRIVALVEPIFSLTGSFSRRLFFYMAAGVRPPHDKPRGGPGYTEFQRANRQIDAFQGMTAFGNSPAAIELATAFSAKMKALRKSRFKGGKPNGLSFSGHEFLTYCELRDDRCAFLVHVPELRRFNDRAKNALAELAWETVCRFLSEKQEARPGMPLTVGLRGITLYDRVLAGIYSGDPNNTNEDIWPDRSPKVDNTPQPLYPYFAMDPDSSSKPTNVTAELSNAVILYFAYFSRSKGMERLKARYGDSAEHFGTVIDGIYSSFGNIEGLESLDVDKACELAEQLIRREYPYLSDSAVDKLVSRLGYSLSR